MSTTETTTLWSHVTYAAKRAGRGVLQEALKAYYVAIDPTTPMPARAVLFGALAYLGLPIDAVPDVLPLLGFSDDLGVLVAAVAAAKTYVKPEHLRQAEAAADGLFGK